MSTSNPGSAGSAAGKAAGAAVAPTAAYNKSFDASFNTGYNNATYGGRTHFLDEDELLEDETQILEGSDK